MVMLCACPGGQATTETDTTGATVTETVSGSSSTTRTTTESPDTTTASPGATTESTGATTDTTGDDTGWCGTTCPQDPSDSSSGTDGEECEGWSICGNGQRKCEEECDLGADNSDDGDCTTSCRAAVCGDGLVHAGVEQCDDGNDIDDDACPNNCGNSFSHTPSRIVAGSHHMCALSSAGKVRCWGGSPQHKGQLGYGSTQAVGDDPGEMPPPDVDVGGTVIQLAAANQHTCALLAGGTAKCWGWGFDGALGYGSTEDIGDEPGEMPPPDVDVGGEVAQIAATHFGTCALLTSGAVRCWGSTAGGTFGDEPGEMPPPDLAVTGKIVALHGGLHYSCALRENGTAACWHHTYEPQPYEVWFGGFIVGLAGDLCALLSDGAVRCMGNNDYGQAGYGEQFDGDPAYYIPDAIAKGDVPVGGAATRLVSHYRTCATLDTGKVRCWGENKKGGLGYGHTDELGDDPGELPTPDLALGGTPLDVALTPNYTCALFASDVVRCWGRGSEGNLGYGNDQSIGDGPGEMPPPPVLVF